MSITSLRYAPPVRRDLTTRTLDYQLLETAGEQYDAGDFLGAARTVFRHLLGDDAPDLSAPFAFTQGSSRISVRFDDGACTVSVPLAGLAGGGNAVAAMRYVLTRVNGSGQLFQGRLRGDDIVLEFHERVSALHPQKLLEVLRQMPMAADRHDDWLIAQFGVTPLERGHVEPLDDAEAAAAEELWRTHWSDVEELLKEAQRKRSVWFLNELTAFAINRITFALPLAGSLLPRLNEAASVFNDADVDPMKRESTLGKFVREMKAVGADELRKNLGHVSYSIDPHREGTPERIAEYFGPGNYMETVEKYRTTGYALDAALALIGTCYYLLANNAWPPAIAAELKAGLAATSGKPWREAAASLTVFVKDLVERVGAGAEASEEADGEADETGEAGDEEVAS